MPAWLPVLAATWIALSLLSAGWLLLDLRRRPPQMGVMALVWPLTGLYLGPMALAAYMAFGRALPPGSKHAQAMGERPLWQSAFLGACHCGGGCALGDFLAEWLVFWTGLTIAGAALPADYALDFAFAYGLGIVFQYYSIVPMQGLGFREGLIAAIKADTLSIIAYEIGMFAFMALSRLVLFPHLEPDRWTYWFMMQVAMMVGFLTTMPANALLVRAGIKEAM